MSAENLDDQTYVGDNECLHDSAQSIPPEVMPDAPCDADVIIIGGGPAGSTAGLALKKRNPKLNVLLLDRATFPRDKACGDGIGPGAIRVLRELNATDVVEKAACPLTVRVTGPGGTHGSATGPFVAGRELTGRVLPRFEFDNRLLSAAREAGVEVREGVAFLGSAACGSWREVTVSGGGTDEKELLRTRLLIGADGSMSKVRSAFGVPKQDQRSTHFAIRSYVSYEDPESSDPSSNPLRMDFTGELLPAYGWIFPTDAGRANLGVGLPLATMRRRRVNINALLDQYVSLLEMRGFSIGETEDRKSALLPHSRELGPLVHPQGVLIGDASGMINPLSGEGIAYGMVAANMLAESLKDWDGASASNLEEALRRFDIQFRRRFRLHLASCLLAHKLLGTEHNTKVVVGAAGRSQDVMDDAALMLFSEGRMHAGTVGRIALHGLGMALTRR